MEKYWVRSLFFDNGRTKFQIITESEAFEMDKTNKSEKTFDEYWDYFESYEEAEEFVNQ